MTKPDFGRLERVGLRTAWSREDTDFTPWLAEPNNLKLLGDAIGLELEVQAQEQAVGPFRADLFCTDTVNGSRVLIENQIERTDHTHLGQILTYAAGLDAVTIVWIAARFTDEHRAALDWLNEVSHEDIRFFGLEVELWRIGESAVAPKFNMVAKPNDWSKTVREAAAARAAGATTDGQIRNREFWSGFCAHLAEAGSRISSNRTPGVENWMDWGIGRSGFALLASLNSFSGTASAQLVVRPPADASHFHELSADSEAIHAAVGLELTWDHQEGRKQNYAYASLPVSDLDDRSDWPRIYAWLADVLGRLEGAFRPRVAALGASDASPETESP